MTFSSHSSLQTLLEAAVLTLVAMVLIDGAVATTSTRVSQISTHRSLEETLATLARELPVVLPARLVSAHDALDVRLLHVARRRVRRISVSGVVIVSGERQLVMTTRRAADRVRMMVMMM